LKEVVSASRRTDMPAFYLDELINDIKKGFAEVRNPFSGKVTEVSLEPEKVHTLVLWSKNFRPFLKKIDCFSLYGLYFLFTVNDMPELEPNVPPLSERLDTMYELSEKFGPERIGWRFDPVVFSSGGTGAIIDIFEKIADKVVLTGVKRVIFSFMDNYPKIDNRLKKKNISLSVFDDATKRRIARELSAISHKSGLALENCCDDIGEAEGVIKRGCIDGALLSALAGEPANIRKDTGQRKTCLCTKSRDIGSYSDMPCPHGCLYCYANPVIND
jgi:DNA repair photolyase